MKLFAIIDQLNSAQIDQLHELFQQMWWTKERTMDDIAVMLKNSMSFGVIERDTGSLVAYARVLTDEIKYAFIFDVMTVDCHRGKGLGKLIMNAIMTHPRLENIKNFELTCAPDMVPFYEKFGFSKDYGSDVSPMRHTKVK